MEILSAGYLVQLNGMTVLVNAGTGITFDDHMRDALTKAGVASEYIDHIVFRLVVSKKASVERDSERFGHRQITYHEYALVSSEVLQNGDYTANRHFANIVFACA